MNTVLIDTYIGVLDSNNKIDSISEFHMEKETDCIHTLHTYNSFSMAANSSNIWCTTEACGGVCTVNESRLIPITVEVSEVGTRWEMFSKVCISEGKNICTGKIAEQQNSRCIAKVTGSLIPKAGWNLGMRQLYVYS